MASHDALRRSLKFKLKLILSENKILVQTIEQHVKRAEAIYRDTESMDKIPTKVFKRAMARLETAYSACIKLILLASDLFESSDKNSPQDYPDVSGSASNRLDDSVDTGVSMRSLDKETLRRLSSLERKFQNYVAMRGQETCGMPDMSGTREWPPAGGQVYHRMCGHEGPDVFCRADPATELQRFLFGLDCQSYDGYRDPRIILSNERKKFPNEVMADTVRAGQAQRHVSPPRDAEYPETIGGAIGGGPATYYGAANETYCGRVDAGHFDGGGPSGVGYNLHVRDADSRCARYGAMGGLEMVQLVPGQSSPGPTDRLIVGNVPGAVGDSHTRSVRRDGEPVTDAHMLDSPAGRARPESPDIRVARREDVDPGRNVVTAAAEKLSHVLGQIQSLPIRWIKRAQRTLSPPSPPPPSSETYRSPQRVTSARPHGQVAHTWGGVPQLSAFATVLPEKQAHITSPRQQLGASPYARREPNVLPTRDLGEEHQVSSAPKLFYDAVEHISPGAKPVYFHSPQYQMSIEPEPNQEHRILQEPVCICVNGKVVKSTSPKKITNPMDVPGSGNTEEPRSPQRCFAPVKHESPAAPNRPDPGLVCHPAQSAPALQVQTKLSQIQSQGGDDTVHCILERISKMEHLLEEEISAERGLLTKCLAEFQKLLGTCGAGNGEGGGLDWPQCEQGEKRAGNEIPGRTKFELVDSQNVHTLLPGNKKQTPGKKQLKTCFEETDSAVNNISSRDEKHQPHIDKRKRQKGDLQDAGTVRKSVGKKKSRQPIKKSAGSRGKDVIRYPGENTALREHQDTAGKEGRGVEDSKPCASHNARHNEMNVTTTSCSLTGSWEDTGSSEHLENSAAITQQGAASCSRRCGAEQSSQSSAREDGQGQGVTKYSTLEDDTKKRRDSPRGLADLETKRGRCADMAEEKLRKSFQQAQKAMLHMMIEKVNAHLLAMSTLGGFDSSSSCCTYDQRESDQQHCKIDLTSGLQQVSTKPLALSSKTSQENSPDAVCDQDQSKAKSLQNITTQTCEMDNLVDIDTFLPETADYGPNEESLKNLLPQSNTGLLDPAPDVAISPARNSHQTSDKALQSGNPPPLQQVQKSLEKSGQPLSQSMQKQSLQAEKNLLDIPISADFSPQNKPLPPVRLHPRPASGTTGPGMTTTKPHRIVKEELYSDQLGHRELVLQSNPGFPQQPHHSWRNKDGTLCALDFLRNQQLAPQHPNFVCSVPGEELTADALERAPRRWSGQPGSLMHSNTLRGALYDGNGEADILYPSEHQTLGYSSYSCEPAGPRLAHGLYQHHVTAGQQDRYSHLCQIQLQQQSQQSTTDQDLQQRHGEEQRVPQPHYQQHLYHHAYGDQRVEHEQKVWKQQILQQQHQQQQQQQQQNPPCIPWNPPLEVSAPGRCEPYKTHSNSHVNLPTSCPTVAFASGSDHCAPMWLAQQTPVAVLPTSTFPPLQQPAWNPNPGSITWAPQNSQGPTSSLGSRSRPRSRFTPQRFGSPMPSGVGPVTSKTSAAAEDKAPSKNTEIRVETQKLPGMRRALSQGPSARPKAEHRTVCIRNLPPHLEEMELLKVLNQHGFVSKIYFIKHRTTGQFQGTAYAKFRECPEAESAVDALNRLVLEGQQISAAMMSKQSPKENS